MFCPVICIVEFARFPIDAELFLAFSVSEPMDSHIHCLGPFWLLISIDDTVNHCVASLEWRVRLFVVPFLQDDANVHSFSCHDVQ